jgi:hypothetical protein
MNFFQVSVKDNSRVFPIHHHNSPKTLIYFNFVANVITLWEEKKRSWKKKHHFNVKCVFPLKFCHFWEIKKFGKIILSFFFSLTLQFHGQDVYGDTIRILVPHSHKFVVSLYTMFMTCVMTLAFGLRSRQGHGKVWIKSVAWESHSHSQECGRMWGNEPTHSPVDSHFGSWKPNGLSNLQIAIWRFKTHWIENFLILL